MIWYVPTNLEDKIRRESGERMLVARENGKVKADCLELDGNPKR